MLSFLTNAFRSGHIRQRWEKCATGRFLLCCYVKKCQLFFKLSGGIFQCWIAVIWGSVQVYIEARLMTNSILYQLAFWALMIHLPSWWSGQKFEEIWEFILLARSIWSICSIAQHGQGLNCIVEKLNFWRFSIFLKFLKNSNSNIFKKNQYK